MLLGNTLNPADPPASDFGLAPTVALNTGCGKLLRWLRAEVLISLVWVETGHQYFSKAPERILIFFFLNTEGRAQIPDIVKIVLCPNFPTFSVTRRKRYDLCSLIIYFNGPTNGTSLIGLFIMKNITHKKHL